MKFVLACFLVATLAVSALAALTEEEKAKVLEFRAACTTETGVDAAKVEKIKNDKVYPEGDDSVDKYLLCFMKKIGWFSDDTTIAVDKIKARIPADADKEAAFKIIDECVKIADGAATARKVAKCLTEGRQNYLATH